MNSDILGYILTWVPPIERARLECTERMFRRVNTRIPRLIADKKQALWEYRLRKNWQQQHFIERKMPLPGVPLVKPVWYGEETLLMPISQSLYSLPPLKHELRFPFQILSIIASPPYVGIIGCLRICLYDWTNRSIRLDLATRVAIPEAVLLGETLVVQTESNQLTVYEGFQVQKELPCPAVHSLSLNSDWLVALTEK